MELDNIKQIQKMDKGQVAKSIELLPAQIRQVLDDARLINIPREYSKCTHVVVNGMGGSNLGIRIIKNVLADQIKIPISITPGYTVPNYVGPDTLYIISSYSGDTEEPLSVYQEIKKRRAKIMAITMYNPKNKLGKLMLKENIPGYIFKPEYNPSGQPRLGVGYTAFGTAAIMAKAGLFKIKVREIEDMITSMEIWGRLYKIKSPIKNNEAKLLAEKIWGRIPVFIGAEFLVGNLHALRNQINECAKQFASYLPLPDLNHYAMEGLVNPKENKDNLIFIFVDSKLYSPRIQKRATLTKKVVAKNKIPVFPFVLKGENKITQAFELLQLGSWTSYYLGMLNDVDPIKIPWVDWFKKQLK
jgi:glucose/mannose-6-phosphate isomerase